MSEVLQWKTKLVGTTFQGRQANIDLVGDGQELYWFHEIDNKFDSNAIHVFADPNKSISLGHLNKKMAAHVVERNANGFDHKIFCVQVTGKDKPFKGINISIIARK